jgi:hypothetical protein
MAYTAVSPQAFDPFQIETPLAQEAAKGSPGAIQLLAGYMAQRGAAQSGYTQELEQQRQIARDTLAAEMAKNRVSGVTGLLKEPGGLELAMSSPSLRQELFPDTPVDTAAGIAGLQNRAQVASILEKTLAGGKSGVEAGFTPDIRQLSSVSGVSLSPTTPLPIQVANIGAAGRIAAAGAANQPTMSVSVPLPIDPNTGKSPGTVSIGGKRADTDTILQRALSGQSTFAPNRPPTIGPEAPASRTNLPLAQSDEGTTSAPPSNKVGPGMQPNQREGVSGSPMDITTSAGQAYQAQARVWLQRAMQSPNAADKKAAADVRAGMNGNVIPLEQRADGSIGIKGRSGQVY